jgi:hypothetical protein
MTKPKTKTKVKDNKSIAEKLNEVSTQPSKTEVEEKLNALTNAENTQTDDAVSVAKSWRENQDEINEKYEQVRSDVSEGVSNLFERWESGDFEPQDFEVDVPIDSLESAVGYSSLLRQMHQSFLKRVAYYRSSAGGALSCDEARKAAFRPCENYEEANASYMSAPEN